MPTDINMQIQAGDFALLKREKDRFFQPIQILNVTHQDNTRMIKYFDLQTIIELPIAQIELQDFESAAQTLADFYHEYLQSLFVLAESGDIDILFAVANLAWFWSYHGKWDQHQAMGQAKDYFALASDAGDAESSYQLAQMYRKIINPDYDAFFSFKRQENVVYYLQTAAKQGHAIAQYQLGYAYEYQLHGLSQDYLLAVNWYQQAAAQHYPLALNNLGDKYEKGKGVKKDYQKAAHYYQQAVQHQIVEAIYNLGRLHLRGLGVIKDEVLGRNLIEQAAQSYYKPAQRKLKSLDV